MESPKFEAPAFLSSSPLVVGAAGDDCGGADRLAGCRAGIAAAARVRSTCQRSTVARAPPDSCAARDAVAQSDTGTTRHPGATGDTQPARDARASTATACDSWSGTIA